MLWRQLFLVGFAVLVMPGTIEQLMSSFLVTLSCMFKTITVSPGQRVGFSPPGQTDTGLIDRSCPELWATQGTIYH